MSHLLNCNKFSVKCDVTDLQVANNGYKDDRILEWWNLKTQFRTLPLEPPSLPLPLLLLPLST